MAREDCRQSTLMVSWLFGYVKTSFNWTRRLPCCTYVKGQTRSADSWVNIVVQLNKVARQRNDSKFIHPAGFVPWILCVSLQKTLGLLALTHHTSMATFWTWLVQGDLELLEWHGTFRTLWENGNDNWAIRTPHSPPVWRGLLKENLIKDYPRAWDSIHDPAVSGHEGGDFMQCKGLGTCSLYKEVARE